MFHSVDWTRDTAYRTAFGEADFIIVNQSRRHSRDRTKIRHTLEESSSGLIKRYADGQKNVTTQIHRTLDGLRARGETNLALDDFVNKLDPATQAAGEKAAQPWVAAVKEPKG